MPKTFEELRDEFLETQKGELKHYGVAGMKWGKRKAATSGGDGGDSGPTRRDLKTLDKQTKARQKSDRNAAIDQARNDYERNARARYLDAKDKYNAEKHVIGKAAAKEAFNKVKLENIQQAEVAQQTKSGAETVLTIAAIGAFAIGYAAVTAYARS